MTVRYGSFFCCASDHELQAQRDTARAVLLVLCWWQVSVGRSAGEWMPDLLLHKMLEPCLGFRCQAYKQG